MGVTETQSPENRLSGYLSSTVAPSSPTDPNLNLLLNLAYENISGILPVQLHLQQNLPHKLLSSYYVIIKTWFHIFADAITLFIYLPICTVDTYTLCIYCLDITMNNFSHEQKQILTLNSLLLKYVGSNLNSFTYAFFRSPGKKNHLKCS